MRILPPDLYSDPNRNIFDLETIHLDVVYIQSKTHPVSILILDELSHEGTSDRNKMDISLDAH